MPAIKPYCGEVKVKVRVVEWLGHRVLLQEIANPRFLIDTELGSFEMDIPQEAQ